MVIWQVSDDGGGGRRLHRLDQRVDRRARAQHPAVPQPLAEQSADRLQAERVVVERPTAEHDRRLVPQRTRRRAGRQPDLGGVGGEMLVGDVEPAGVPPVSDLPHGRHQHLVDGAVQAQRLAGDLQRSGDPVRRQVAGALQERLDQRAGPRRVTGPDQRRGLAGTPTSGDQVPHRPEPPELVRGVAAMPAAAPVGHRYAVAALPRADGRRGHVQGRGRLLDGQLIGLA